MKKEMHANEGLSALFGESIAEEAERLIHGEKRDAYGSARESFDRIAAIWSGILGVPVHAEQVALCMVGLKVYREAHKPKRDNLVDAIGYVLLLNDIQGDS